MSAGLILAYQPSSGYLFFITFFLIQCKLGQVASVNETVNSRFTRGRSCTKEAKQISLNSYLLFSTWPKSSAPCKPFIDGDSRTQHSPSLLVKDMERVTGSRLN